MNAPGPFNFLDPGPLVDAELQLVLIERQPADQSQWDVPAYIFHMRHLPLEQKIGRLSLRIANTRTITHFSGHIG